VGRHWLGTSDVPLKLSATPFLTQFRVSELHLDRRRNSSKLASPLDWRGVSLLGAFDGAAVGEGTHQRPLSYDQGMLFLGFHLGEFSFELVNLLLQR
jgi:hypothetical protein